MNRAAFRLIMLNVLVLNVLLRIIIEIVFCRIEVPVYVMEGGSK